MIDKLHVAVLLGLTLGHAYAAEQATEPLQRNPFVAPRVLEPPPVAVLPRRVAPEPDVPPAPQFGLRAVLSAGHHSLANIDGTILGVGEAIEGFRLVSIGEHSVVLKRRGQRVVLDLFVDPDEEARN